MYMAHQLTRLRLYAAWRNASFLGLEGTAGRLKVLRRQLAIKHLDDKGENDQRIWAHAKIDDTKRMLDKEASDIDRRLNNISATRGRYPTSDIELEDVEVNLGTSRAINRVGKALMSIVVFIGMYDPIRHLLQDDFSRWEAVKVGAALVTALMALFKLVDMFVSKDLEYCVASIRGALDFSAQTVRKPRESLAKEEN